MTSVSAARTTASSTSTRCRPSYLSLGAALNDQVANPFFGLPAGQGKSVTSATIQRRELLRPFPQFNDILMRQSTLGESQYHAAVLKFEKRISNGWGGRVNYTYSRLKDNQFGESNFFSRNATEAQDVYNLDAEYSIGLLDVPHKITMSPIIELPFGEGKRWATGGIAAADPRRLDHLVDHLDRERLPDRRGVQHQQHRHLHPHAARQPDRLRRGDDRRLATSTASRRRPAPPASSSDAARSACG